MIQRMTRSVPIFVLLCVAASVGSMTNAQDGIDCSYLGYLGSHQPIQTNEYIEMLDVAVFDQIAYTLSYGDEFAGLVATDITDPANPITLGSLSIRLDQSMVIKDGFAYCISFDGFMTIVNIADPTAMTVASTIELVDRAEVYGINGSTLYAGRGQSLFIIDVSDPHAPTIIIEYATSAHIRDAHIHNTLAVLSYWSGTIETLDITDPANPSLLSSYETGIAELDQITISENETLYAISQDVLSVIDLSIPQLPVEISRAQLSELLDDQQIDGLSDIEIHDAVLGITFEEGGFFTLNAQNPSNITLLGNLSTPGYAYNLELNAGFGYVADSGAGLTIVELAKLNTIEPKVGELYTDGSDAFKTVVADGIAYVGNGKLGIQIIDVSDPALPVLLSTYPADPSASENFAFKAGFIFLPNNNSGLHIVDARDPNNPQLATIAIPSISTDAIAIENDLACIATGDGGVFVALDIQDPENPVLKSVFSVEEFGTAHLMTLKDQMLHIYKDIRESQEPTKLFVYDITDRMNPAFIGEVALGQHRLRSLVVGDEYIYASSGDTMYIVERAGLALMNTTQIFDDIHSLKIVGDRLYAGVGYNKFNVYDISMPTQPGFLTSSRTNSDVLGIDVVDSFAYLSTTTHSLEIFNVSEGCSICPGDLDGDGLLDLSDVSVFLSLFAMSDPRADFTGDGAWNFFDVSAFLGAFGAGCP